MAIEKISTNCIILKSYERGESDMLYKIYSRDLGLIFALAKSVRKIESKLRPNLRVNHYTHLTVVKGKEYYRITGAIYLIEDNNIDQEISKAIERFLIGDGISKRLFDRIYEIRNYNTEDEYKLLAIYYLILVTLGLLDFEVINIKDKNEFANIETSLLITYIIMSKAGLSKSIRKSIAESQL